MMISLISQQCLLIILPSPNVALVIVDAGCDLLRILVIKLFFYHLEGSSRLHSTRHALKFFFCIVLKVFHSLQEV